MEPYSLEAKRLMTVSRGFPKDLAYWWVKKLTLVSKILLTCCQCSYRKTEHWVFVQRELRRKRQLLGQLEVWIELMPFLLVPFLRLEMVRGLVSEELRVR
jgi:hypothetical protein